MAKLFYTLSEAADKLGKSEDEIKAMVDSGKIQEFRDRDRLMFKRDQIDLLSGSDDELSASASGTGGIPLAESGELGTISLASDSGTGIPLESPKEQTGISIFEADQTEEADPSAVTQITETSPGEVALETMGSGSGLLDLTREADDTSLGQNLLEESQPMAEAPAEAEGTVDGSAAGVDSGPLFESTGAEAETAATPQLLAAMAEPISPGWSGLTGGVAVGMCALFAAILATTIFGLRGAGGPVIETIRSNPMMWVGVAAGIIVLPAIIGMLVGRKS